MQGLCRYHKRLGLLEELAINWDAYWKVEETQTHCIDVVFGCQEYCMNACNNDVCHDFYDFDVIVSAI